MAASTPIYISDLVSLYAQADWTGKLIGISIVTDQQNVAFSSGYVGDNSKKDRAMDFTESLDFREVTIKCWLDENKTVLKAVAVFSKIKAPFQLTVHIQRNPPIDEAVNVKYIEALRGLNPITRTYQLLSENPHEYPMISEEEIKKRLGCSRVFPDNGFVDLRSEISRRYECFYV